MNNRIARWIAPILWAPLLVLVAACGDESPTGPSSTVTGTWSLTAVNGGALPLALIDVGGIRLEVVSGSVALRTGNRFASRITSRETVDGVTSIVNNDVLGRFVISGSTLRVTLSGETTATFTATLSDGNTRITFVDDGVTYLFQRSGTAPPDEGS
ncbi:MAG TPA: hypothetical protein VJ925_07415 [Longimicrobiales bacterium]|nr:hypothetical protein [Longimicrobiales bacterium]